MLKAIITVLDEDDKILAANRLIFEDPYLERPIYLGTEHVFNFKIITMDKEVMDKYDDFISKSCQINSDEIKKMLKEDKEE